MTNLKKFFFISTTQDARGSNFAMVEHILAQLIRYVLSDGKKTSLHLNSSTVFTLLTGLRCLLAPGSKIHRDSALDSQQGIVPLAVGLRPFWLVPVWCRVALGSGGSGMGSAGSRMGEMTGVSGGAHREWSALVAGAPGGTCHFGSWLRLGPGVLLGPHGLGVPVSAGNWVFPQQWGIRGLGVRADPGAGVSAVGPSCPKELLSLGLGAYSLLISWDPLVGWRGSDLSPCGSSSQLLPFGCPLLPMLHPVFPNRTQVRAQRSTSIISLTFFFSLPVSQFSLV